MTEKNNSELDIDSDELVENRIIVADPKQSPMRIDKFLMSRVDRLSRSKLQSTIKAGCVLVDGKEVKPNYKIRPNDSINLIIPINPNAEFALAPENIPLDIVYEDRDVLIINKPAGLVVHPGIGNHSGTLVNALMYHLSKELPVMEGNSYDRPGIVHRIDKDTTGLMVIAKNEESMSHLAKQFFNHSI